MKGLLWGVVAIVIIGIGGFVYRNAAEHPYQKIACPLDAKVCPDGTTLSRTGQSCTFPACPPPNVTLTSAQLQFAIPKGFASTTFSGDPALVAAYRQVDATASTTAGALITIRRYTIASSTPLAFIQQNATQNAVGTQVAATSFTSNIIGGYPFTIITLQRSQGVIDTAYYLAQGDHVIRLDAIDTNVSNWSDPALTVSSLPAHAALQKLLSTLQVLQ